MLTLRQRFEEKYVPDPNSGCWIWIASSNSGGYGTIAVSRRYTELAHRVSYALFVGPVPDNACVLHKCDTPCCVNPDHLFLGSRTDNNLDKSLKGRCYRKQNKLPQGVSRSGSKFAVRLYCNGSVRAGGRLYDTPEDASVRYHELLASAIKENRSE